MLSLFRRQPQPQPREIFAYSDGSRQRYADPVAVMRAMANHPSLDLNTNIEQMQSTDTKLQTEAALTAVQATREIFDVQPWSEENPTGLTEMETLDLLAQFVNYTDQLKKNTSGEQT